MKAIQFHPTRSKASFFHGAKVGGGGGGGSVMYGPHATAIFQILTAKLSAREWEVRGGKRETSDCRIAKRPE